MTNISSPLESNRIRTIYLLRHGHSEFQARVEAGRPSSDLVDTGLYAIGRKQVKTLADLAPVIFDVVVSSPLTRAIETALAVVGPTSSAPLIVNPLVRERLDDFCDIGRPATVLSSAYPNLDFTGLPEIWWHNGPEDERGLPVEPWKSLTDRVERFKEWTATRKEQSILIVSHSDFLYSLTGTRLPNCQLQKWEEAD